MRARWRLFASDLDGTLLGDASGTAAFCAAWKEVPPAFRPRLAYTSGRTVEDMRDLIVAGVLPAADYLVGSVGTEFVEYAKGIGEPAFEHRFLDGWDRDRICEIVAAERGLLEQGAESQTRWKCSWYWPSAGTGEVERLRARLRAAGQAVLVVHSAGLYLDILPAQGGKGHSLAWLCAREGIALESVIVAGDSLNDADLFAVPGVQGLLVANAEPRLRAFLRGQPCLRTRGRGPWGVLEGLRRLGLPLPPQG